MYIPIVKSIQIVHICVCSAAHCRYIGPLSPLSIRHADCDITSCHHVDYPIGNRDIRAWQMLRPIILYSYVTKVKGGPVSLIIIIICLSLYCVFVRNMPESYVYSCNIHDNNYIIFCMLTCCIIILLILSV